MNRSSGNTPEEPTKYAGRSGYLGMNQDHPSNNTTDISYNMLPVTIGAKIEWAEIVHWTILEV